MNDGDYDRFDGGYLCRYYSPFGEPVVTGTVDRCRLSVVSIAILLTCYWTSDSGIVSALPVSVVRLRRGSAADLSILSLERST